MMATGFADDMRQALVVAKNEMLKYLRGRKALILAVIILAMWGLATALPYVFGEGMEDPLESLSQYYGSAWMIIIIIVAMFSSGTVVSEFEDRTALVLFTRPIRKGSIFLGKIVAALAFGTVAILIYAVLSLATVFVATGGLSGNIPVPLLLMAMAVFAATGVAVLISSVFKRSSTAAIVTFFMLFLVTSIVYATMTLFNMDPWFMVDTFRMDIPRAIANGFERLPSSYYVVPGYEIEVFDPSYDPLRSVGVGLAWGLAGMLLSFLSFSRKEV